jgi:lipid-A-disaccharide synthase
MGEKSVLIVAGEASSDAHGAGLVRALRARGVAARFYGVGGPALEAAGVELVARYDQLAVVGLFEALAVLPRALRLMNELKRSIRRNPPDLFLPVDSPEINLRLARTAAECGVPVVYFVAPQVWAWRAGRVRQIRRNVRELLVLFPFEIAWFSARDVAATYVGHPLVEAAGARLDASAAPPKRAHEGAQQVLLLPGSRPGEVRHHLPVMAAAVASLRAAGASGLKCRLRMADALAERDYQPWAQQADIVLCRDPIFDLARDADLVVAASGTASFEASLMEAPTIVVYRVSAMTWWLARRLVRVPHVAMTNLAAGEAILPELLQDDLTAPRLAQEMASLLADPDRRAAMRAALARVRGTFGPPGAYERAAERVAAHLDAR